jgi:hypothetical protein
MYVSLLLGDRTDNDRCWFVRYRVALTRRDSTTHAPSYVSRHVYAHNGRQGKQLQPGGGHFEGTKTDIRT